MISLCSKFIMQFRLINPIISEHIMVFFLITKKNLRAAVVGYKRLTPLLYVYLSKTFSINEVDQMEEVRTKKMNVILLVSREKQMCSFDCAPLIGELDHDSSISSQNFGL